MTKTPGMAFNYFASTIGRQPREKTVWLFTRTPVEPGALGRPSKDAFATSFFRLMFAATSSGSSQAITLTSVLPI